MTLTLRQMQHLVIQEYLCAKFPFTPFESRLGLGLELWWDHCGD